MDVKDVEALALEHAAERGRRRDGLRMMFGSDPFAGTITERPTGMHAGGRLAVTADAGVETRVN